MRLNLFVFILLASVFCFSILLQAEDLSIAVQELDAQSFFSYIEGKMGKSITVSPEVDLLITFNTYGEYIPAEKIFWTTTAKYGIIVEEKGNSYHLKMHPEWTQSASARQVNISPISVGNGIDNGMVTIHGNKIDPPYIVEKRSDGVYLQGILIDPLPEKESSKTLTDYQQEQSELFERLWNLSEMNLQDAHQKLLIEAKNSPIVKSAVWKGPYKMEILFDNDETIEFMMEDKGGRIDYSSDDLEKERPLDFAQIIKTTLTNGGGIAIGNEYTILLTENEVSNIADRLNEILPCNESPTRCLSKLQGVLDSHYWALDVMYNY